MRDLRVERHRRSGVLDLVGRPLLRLGAPTVGRLRLGGRHAGAVAVSGCSDTCSEIFRRPTRLLPNGTVVIGCVSLPQRRTIIGPLVLGGAAGRLSGPRRRARIQGPAPVRADSLSRCAIIGNMQKAHDRRIWRNRADGWRYHSDRRSTASSCQEPKRRTYPGRRPRQPSWPEQVCRVPAMTMGLTVPPESRCVRRLVSGLVWRAAARWLLRATPRAIPTGGSVGRVNASAGWYQS